LIGGSIPLGCLRLTLVYLRFTLAEVQLPQLRSAFPIGQLLLAVIQADVTLVSEAFDFIGQDAPFDDRPLFVPEFVALQLGFAVADLGVDLTLLAERLRRKALVLVSGHPLSVGTVGPTVTTGSNRTSE
jgi:hypothetical protein